MGRGKRGIRGIMKDSTRESMYRRVSEHSSLFTDSTDLSDSSQTAETGGAA